MRKSKMVLGVTIGLSIILIGTGITYYVLNKRDNKEIAKMKQDLENKLTLDNRAYEYGSEIKLQDLNLDDNVKVYINSQELNDTYKFTEIGEYNLKIEISQTYKNFLNKQEVITANKETIIKVQDTKNPIIEGVTDKKITEGDTIDLKQGITAKDEIDGDLELIVEGEVDTSKVGAYEIKVKATDKNNNTTGETYRVTVNAKSEEVVKRSNLSLSNQTTKTSTNNSTDSKLTNSKETNTTNKAKNNSSTQKKSNITTNKNNLGSTSNSSTSSEEQATYKGTTDGKKYYFQDRGEEGNYGEKFSW